MEKLKKAWTCLDEIAPMTSAMLPKLLLMCCVSAMRTGSEEVRLSDPAKSIMFKTPHKVCGGTAAAVSHAGLPECFAVILSCNGVRQIDERVKMLEKWFVRHLKNAM